MSVDEVLGAPSDETGLGLRWRLVDPRRNPSPGPMLLFLLFSGKDPVILLYSSPSLEALPPP